MGGSSRTVLESPRNLSIKSHRGTRLVGDDRLDESWKNQLKPSSRNNTPKSSMVNASLNYRQCECANGVKAYAG